MDTRQLIRAISADVGKPGLSMRNTLLVVSALSLAAAAVAFFTMLGLRPDFGEAIKTMRFPLKFVTTGALTVSAFVVFAGLVRPAGKAWYAWLYVGPIVLICGVMFEMLSVPTSEWGARLVGTNSMKCLAFILLIGAAPLAAFLAALRHGASTRPVLSGAMAGILAGGMTATFYAAHCPDDSPFFVATWYTIAIAILGVIGALVGGRVAHW
jgi:hypothetical protein